MLGDRHAYLYLPGGSICIEPLHLELMDNEVDNKEESCQLQSVQALLPTNCVKKLVQSTYCFFFFDKTAVSLSQCFHLSFPSLTVDQWRHILKTLLLVRTLLWQQMMEAQIHCQQKMRDAMTCLNPLRHPS